MTTEEFPKPGFVVGQQYNYDVQQACELGEPGNVCIQGPASP